MPKQTLKGLFEAQQAKKLAEEEHNRARNQLLDVVRRVLLETYFGDTDVARRIEISVSQTLLGPKYTEVVIRSQELCGVVIDADERNKLGPTSIALDLASAMNNCGTEVSYRNSRMSHVIREVTEATNIPAAQLVPWKQIGSYHGLLERFAQIPWVKAGDLTLTPETTINEIALALDAPAKAR